MLGDKPALPPNDVLGPQVAPHLTHFIHVVVGSGYAVTVLPNAISRFAGVRNKLTSLGRCQTFLSEISKSAGVGFLNMCSIYLCPQYGEGP